MVLLPVDEYPSMAMLIFFTASEDNGNGRIPNELGYDFLKSSNFTPSVKWLLAPAREYAALA